MKSAVTEKNFVFLTISGRIKLIKFLKLSYNYERNFEMTPFTIVDDLKRKTRKYVIDLLFNECLFKMLRIFPNHFNSKVNIQMFFQPGRDANLLASQLFHCFFIVE